MLCWTEPELPNFFHYRWSVFAHYFHSFTSHDLVPVTMILTLLTPLLSGFLATVIAAPVPYGEPYDLHLTHVSRTPLLAINLYLTIALYARQSLRFLESRGFTDTEICGLPSRNTDAIMKGCGSNAAYDYDAQTGALKPVRHREPHNSGSLVLMSCAVEYGPKGCWEERLPVR